MIPIHQSERTNRKEIIVNQLNTLNEYDFTEFHRHDYFEFFYFVKGGGFHVIDFVPIEIQSNSIHVVAPGQVHQMRRELNSEGFVFLFELGSLEAPKSIEEFLLEHVWLDASEHSPAYFLSMERQTLIIQKIHEIWQNFNSKTLIGNLNVRNNIQGLCIECMKAIGDRQAESTRTEYMEFRKLLHTHFREMKKVRSYAEKLCISEKSLNELVKKRTGKSASAIIYGQLIMEAKRLLNTGISIKETAFQLNFDDPAHFSKFFKVNTGISPSDFQKG